MRTLSLFIVALVALPFIVAAQTTPTSQTQSLSIPELYVGGPAAPVIESPDQVDQFRWYSPQNMTFNWFLPSEVVSVAVDLFTTSGEEPMESYRPPISSIEIKAEDFVEGENYLVVQFRNEEKWGMYSERQILIDGTPPEEFAINVTPVEVSNGDISITFEAQDRLSGISHYVVAVNNNTSITLTPEQAYQGYIITLQEGEKYDINVAAYDQAGNSRTESVSILGVNPPQTPPSSIIDLAKNDPASVLASVMAALILFMLGYLVYERQRYAHNLTNLRRETGEIHDQLLRIFSALREEIYDQIRSISKKSRLSKKEQDAIDGLNKALSVSESLIEREVKDVKKLLD